MLDRVIDLAYRAAKFAFRPSKAEVVERERDALYRALRHVYDRPETGRWQAAREIAAYERSHPDTAIQSRESIDKDVARRVESIRTEVASRFSVFVP